MAADGPTARAVAGVQVRSGSHSHGSDKPIPCIVDRHTQSCLNRFGKRLATNEVVDQAMESTLAVAPGGRFAEVADRRRDQGAVGRGRERAGCEDRGKLVGGVMGPTLVPTHDKDVIMRKM